MIGPKASAKDGSTAIGGDNTGCITNINVGNGSTVDLHLEAEITRKLPSHLGSLIALLASQGGFAMEAAQKQKIPPEVAEKLRHNQLPERHPIIRDWTRHIHANQLSALLRKAAALNGQLILATLRDKLPEMPQAFVVENTILELAHDDKLFKL